MERILILMQEFLQEMETLVEEDDGTVFQIQHIEQMEELSDLIEERTNG
jgi:hypothetical protein